MFASGREMFLQTKQVATDILLRLAKKNVFLQQENFALFADKLRIAKNYHFPNLAPTSVRCRF